MTTKKQALKELATRELIKRHSAEREDLVAFIKHFFKSEKHQEFQENWHHHLIADKLHKVLTGEITRLMINIPPGHMKTELVTKCFPVWALGKKPETQIIATGYSTNLTQTYSNEARDYYNSETFQSVFPRRPELRDDQNTKEWWTNSNNGFYYATGAGGSITGRRCNIFIIDDPLKPDEAESDVKRIGVNNWYENTVLSRLYSPLTDAVIIIMQRTHEDDLCGHLLAKMEEGTGEDWDVLCLPAEAEKEDEYRKEGEALHIDRYPIEALHALKKSLGPVNYSCQYQQNPIAKESQEFHEEWFKYYKDAPVHGRTFTVIDPAFSKKQTADYTAIVTAKFFEDKMYILEISHGRYNPAELEDMVLYHVNKWSPEKVGVEAVAAQSMIGFSLRNRFRKERIRSSVEDLTQRGAKEMKIRRLIPLYRNGLIYHKAEYCEALEQQAVKFPRGAHDDVIDATQMLYDMYEMQPNVRPLYANPVIKFSKSGRPIVS
jgi:predicted phage terminase large subunit-like protein